MGTTAKALARAAGRGRRGSDGVAAGLARTAVEEEDRELKD